MKNKTAYFGVFTSLALILSYVETLIPISFGIPGIKLGLANLVIVIVLYTYGGKEAFLLSVTRILLSGFLFGNLSMILYSMAGGVFSLAIMVLLRRTGGFSIQGVSIAGGVFHNIGQLLLAMMIVETYGSVMLQTTEDKKRIKGVIINKFRGDIRLFEPGVKMMEDLCGIPVLGVIPYYRNIHIEEEDSVGLDYKRMQAYGILFLNMYISIIR